MNILRERAKPSISVAGVTKARYAYQVTLTHPINKSLISNHVFRKNHKTPCPKEAAYQFAEVCASPSIVVESIIRVRERIL